MTSKPKPKPEPLGSTLTWVSDWALFGALLGPLFTVLPYRLAETVLGIGWDGFANDLFLASFGTGIGLGVFGAPIARWAATGLWWLHPALSVLPGPVVGAVSGAALAVAVWAVQPELSGRLAIGTLEDIARVAVPVSTASLGAGFVVYVSLRAGDRWGWGALSIMVLFGVVLLPVSLWFENFR